VASAIQPLLLDSPEVVETGKAGLHTIDRSVPRFEVGYCVMHAHVY
jgi:hypothetical protein